MSHISSLSVSIVVYCKCVVCGKGLRDLSLYNNLILTYYLLQIRAPTKIQILMSALYEGSEACETDNAKRVHKFKQDICIPSYLIAIAGGDIVSK